MADPKEGEAPERDKNAPGSLEADGSGNSADQTGAAIQNDLEAAEEDDEDE